MENVLKTLKELGVKYSDSVEKISLFGSRARGDHGDRSDFDIAVCFKSKVDYDFLREVGSIDTLLNIDVTIFDESLDENFKESIVNEEVAIYGKVSE